MSKADAEIHHDTRPLEYLFPVQNIGYDYVGRHVLEGLGLAGPSPARFLGALSLSLPLFSLSLSLSLSPPPCLCLSLPAPSFFLSHPLSLCLWLLRVLVHCQGSATKLCPEAQRKHPAP